MRRLSSPCESLDEAGSGARVPALVLSPFARKGFVDKPMHPLADVAVARFRLAELAQKDGDRAAAEAGKAAGLSPLEVARETDLGDFAAFDRFVAKAKSLGLEIALDFALQASPDHPWAKAHPEWFTRDAAGKFVLPGGIDSHVHIAQESGPGIVMADQTHEERHTADRKSVV